MASAPIEKQEAGAANSWQRLDRFRLPPGFRGRPAWVVQLWWLVQATLFRLSPQIAYPWRRMLLRLFGARVGKKVLIRPTAQFVYPWKTRIGEYSWIGDQVVLYSLGPIEIGAHSVVSQRSYLCAGTHDPEQHDFPILAKAIQIEDGAWLATDVFVAPGVRIGSGAVVGARSSVFSDLPSGWICYGSPARPIRRRGQRA
ncbi:putative colanic acid biosynthesis acetyltransferase [Verrucomicrobium sp. 3C]|uniref:putative colanic acid biosynthesis acetyltransferase n=1 Tax=Verrucomicrobium sp. 3C TaxID=1134055 RepID=UPI0006862C91|nr:putative colanic acid biosynthesis acetyltransferase [Verrucomicrobium sp. 3C]